MFKKVLLSSLILASAGSWAATTVTGGTVNFEGSVVDAACAVSADSIDQTVQMGQVRTAALADAGATASSVPFNITLEDCDSTVSSSAAVTFSGVASADDATVLAAGQGSGAAQNVAIKIYDNSGSAVNLGELSATTTLLDGTNTLPFVAKYFTPVGSATAGDASAQATFTMTYE